MSMERLGIDPSEVFPKFLTAVWPVRQFLGLLNGKTEEEVHPMTLPKPVIGLFQAVDVTSACHIKRASNTL